MQTGHQLVGGKVSRKGFERLVPIEEDDRILARLEEVLDRGGATSAGAKVVDKANRVQLDRHGRATRLFRTITTFD